MRTFSLAAPFLNAAPFVRLMDAIEPAGPARVVGGAVRNTLLGEPVGDIDVATAARPEAVARAAAAAGLGVHETGLDHGTLTIVASGHPFEVTTLREDVATDGRRAVVRFTDDFARDAARRDFTLNALYVDRAGAGIDPAGGYDDCLARRVRFIGDPHMRIREDHLRILRFFRFTAAYADGPPDAEGLAACLALRDRLDDLPAERIANELSRTVLARRAAEIVATMAAGGVLDRVIAPPHDLAAFAALAALEREAGRASVPLRLAALVGADAARFERLADALKFSRRDRARGHAAIAARAVLPPPPGEGPARLYALGPEAFADGLLLAAATGADVTDLPAALAAAGAWQRPRFPVGGADLLARGVRPGPELGARLARLEAAWTASGFALDRDALLALDGEAVDKAGPV